MRHILESWCWRSLVPAGFSPHPMPCNADGPASAAFGDGERRGSGELPEDNSSSAGRSTSSGAATSLPLPGREGGK